MKYLLNILILVLFVTPSFAGENKSSRSVVHDPIVEQEGISISLAMQEFVTLHALINPRRLFAKTLNVDESGVYLYKPLNALVFRGVHLDDAQQIHGYFQDNKERTSYVTYLRNSSVLSQT